MNADNYFSGADDVLVNTAYESSSDAEVMIEKSFFDPSNFAAFKPAKPPPTITTCFI